MLKLTGVATAQVAEQRRDIVAKKHTRKYGKKASETVERVMKQRKRGTLRSSSGDKVTSREQAIAIGLSEARRAGAKVPKRKARSSARVREV